MARCVESLSHVKGHHGGSVSLRSKLLHRHIQREMCFAVWEECTELATAIKSLSMNYPESGASALESKMQAGAWRARPPLYD